MSEVCLDLTSTAFSVVPILDFGSVNKESEIEGTVKISNKSKVKEENKDKLVQLMVHRIYTVTVISSSFN